MVRAETDLFVSGLAQDRTGGGVGGSRADEGSGPPESGAPLEERRVRRVGDGAGCAGAPHAVRTRPPRASSVHGWAGRASMLRLGLPGGADEGGAAVYDQELAGDVAGVAGEEEAGGLADVPA